MSPRHAGAEEAGVAAETFRPSRSVPVTTVAELEAALARAEPGDLIDVAPGVYETARPIAVRRKGTAERPIVVRSRVTGGARIAGAAAFAATGAAYVVIEGFEIAHRDGEARDGRFRGAHALIARDCSHLRFTRNRVRIAETREDKPHARRLHWIEFTGEDSHHNRIDHNLIEDKRNGGVMVVLGGSGAATGYRMSRFDRIDHNHFRNFYPGKGNGYETIRVGASTFSHTEGDTLIDSNLFENCDGEAEIVSVKCHRVTLRGNTFLNSRGMLTIRNGNEAVVEGNWFLNPAKKKGAEGVRFFGRGHRVIDNRFEDLTGAAILIRTGDVEQRTGGWHDTTPEKYGHYLRPEKSVIEGNTIVRCAIGISIGDRRPEYPLAPREITIANNVLVGSRVEEVTKPERFTWKGNREADAAPSGAKHLTSADVGPGAR